MTEDEIVDGLTDLMYMSLSKLRELVIGKPGVLWSMIGPLHSLLRKCLPNTPEEPVGL